MTDEVGRKQKVTHDVLGRVLKTEEFKWNGLNVYRTTTNSYNALDQMTSTQVQDENMGVGQVTLMTYDGYGRLKTKHLPIYDDNKVVTYTYNNDDTVQRMTDARGATTDYTYNARRLVTKIEYAPPPGTNIPDIPDAPTVEYTYDAAGNRKTMTEQGFGSVSYQYDALSRLTSESRIFTGLGTTSYTLSYTYNLGGQLTSITDPWGVKVGYVRDITGTLMSVTGEGYDLGEGHEDGRDYMTAISYRAWGAVKNMTYANGVQKMLTYTNRLQPSNYKLNSSSTLTPSPSMDINYSYTADGRLKLSADIKDATLDRAYSYDEVGRMTLAYTGSEARTWVQSGQVGSVVDGPYRQTFTHDAWDNMTTKFGRSFVVNSIQRTIARTFEQTSGRIVGWGYDADGRVSAGDGLTNIYDAAGRLRSTDAGPGFEYDGDGNKARQLMGNPYYLRSSVLGQTIAEIDPSNGTRKNGFVYADRESIATQGMGFIYWQHMDVSGRSVRTTDSHQNQVGRDELDPMEVKVDGPGQQHYGGGTGGNTLDPGGVQAKAASLMDIRMVDFDGLLVPFAMEQSFLQHISSLDKSGQLHWIGWTTITYIDENGEEQTKLAPISSIGRDKKKKAPLTGDKLKKYIKERNEALERLKNNQTCRDYLNSKGITPEELIDAINLQRPYWGPDSSISRLEAGFVNLAEVDMTTKAGLNYAKGAVSHQFKGRGAYDAWTAFWPGGKFSETVEGRSDVYFRDAGLTSGTILHEAIHSATGWTDGDLSYVFDVSIINEETKQLDTKPITEKLRQHGCA